MAKIKILLIALLVCTEIILISSLEFHMKRKKREPDGQRVELAVDPDIDESMIWDREMFWEKDVYSGRHLDELISSFVGGERIVNRHTVLIMYDDESYEDILSFDLSTNGIPSSKFLNFVKYNVRSTPMHIWYKLIGVDNLVQRYLNGISEIRMPHVFYFKPGNKLDAIDEFPIESHDLDKEPEHFKNWVWERMKMKVNLTNEMSEKFIITFHGDGPKTDKLFLFANKNSIIEVFVSQKVTVLALTRQVVYAFLVEQGMEDTTITINQEAVDRFKGMTDKQWLQQTDDLVKSHNVLVDNFSKHLAKTYLRQFKQPVFLPKYTATGFTIKAIPDQLMQTFLEFYDKNQDNREPGCKLPDGSRNGGDIECTSIPLPLEVKIQISDVLKAHVEEWSGQTVEMTRVYGINEYWDRSNRVHTIGEVTEHVLSVELVIKKEMQEKPDWELEILDHKGNIHYTHLDTGMMLMYESSSVPVKRPRPLEGRSYITVVAHFRPRVGWPWRLAAEEVVLSDGHAWENLLILNTPGTLRDEYKASNSPPSREEL